MAGKHGVVLVGGGQVPHCLNELIPRLRIGLPVVALFEEGEVGVLQEPYLKRLGGGISHHLEETLPRDHTDHLELRRRLGDGGP